MRALSHPAGPMTRPTPAARPVPRSHYLQLLTWAFAFFNSLRVVAYLPTLWTIHASGDTSQHSLLTWLTFAGANATMAAWLFEQNGRRANRAIATSACNAVLCSAISVLIVSYRVGEMTGWMA